MTRTVKWLGGIGVLTLAAVASIALLNGCGGSDANRPKLPKATSYYCESCQYIFGIPTDTPIRERVYPLMVCPKCGKRTVAQAFYYTPKAGGKPELYKLMKYSDDQIRAFEAYIKSQPVDSTEFMSPDEALALEGIQTYDKFAGTDKWLRTWGAEPESRPNQLQEMRSKFKSIITVFDPEWPIMPATEVKQW